MDTKTLQVGDWIRILWIGYDLYVISIDENLFYVSCPKWSNRDKMRFHHWRFEQENSIRIIGSSKPNPLYNNITKLSGFIHPVTIKH